MNHKRNILISVLVGIIILGVRHVNADFTFGVPTNLGPAINSAALEVVPSISPDGLELYFIRADEAWVARRETPNAEWEPACNLGVTINSLSDASIPCISADGLSLFFTSSRPGGYGESDIWVARRATHNDPWGDPENLGPTINSASRDWHSSISTDGLELYFSSNRPGGYGRDDMWVTRRATTDAPWGEPESLGSTLNSSTDDACPSISADGLLLFFTSWQSDEYGSNFGLCDVFVARRATTEDPWGPPVNLGSVVNSPYIEWGMSVSADGSMLYFHSNRPGSEGPFDIWQAPIISIVDFNYDGIVDAADMYIMVDNWGTDESLCDIGPMPWGDGIVDVQDLIILAEHLFEDDRLIAHWKLDEETGNNAYDSVSDYDGILQGEPLWKPMDGKTDGALQLDGIDDYISAPFILDPAKGSFSMFAWIKGGAPGQVIISQVGDFGETWLGINASEGKLMTGFCDIYFDPLESEAIITDDQWHHVGLVYDMDVFHRRLYVNGILVGKDDTVVAGNPSDSGLYIGASKDLDANSFFSGLIDDVRIYNTVLRSLEIEALVR